MIVRETTKAITDTTNPRDVAGAKAVKEMIENAGENVTLKPTTKVNVGGTNKNLNTYINQIAENTTNVLFGEKTVLTATPGDYIESGAITYVKVGKVVTFTANYKMLGAISSSVYLQLDGSMPTPNGSVHIQFKDNVNSDAYDNGVHSFGISNVGGAYLKGPHTADTAYSCSGSYICA